MEVKALIDYHDKDMGRKLIRENTVFEVSEKRAKELIAAGVAVEISRKTKPKSEAANNNTEN